MHTPGLPGWLGLGLQVVNLIMKKFQAASFYFPNLPYLFCQNYRTFLGGVKRGTKWVQAMARKIALKREIVTKRALNTS
jgi:hypothetical protein